jgi:hypothetical protein
MDSANFLHHAQSEGTEGRFFPYFVKIVSTTAADLLSLNKSAQLCVFILYVIKLPLA